MTDIFLEEKINFLAYSHVGIETADVNAFYTKKILLPRFFFHLGVKRSRSCVLFITRNQKYTWFADKNIFSVNAITDTALTQ